MSASPELTELLNEQRRLHRSDEAEIIERLVSLAECPAKKQQVIEQQALRLAERARSLLLGQTSISSLLHEYDLRTEEGVLLMCMAEALLRIPDAETRARLVAEIIARGHWDEHLGHGSSLLVNASTWGLYFGSQVLEQPLLEGEQPQSVLQQLTARVGSKVAQSAMVQAVRLMADHFVMGADIIDAISRAQVEGHKRVSFDCLGEAAQCQRDVDQYFDAYHTTIEEIGKNTTEERLFDQYSISLKLSALHPRYDSFKQQRIMDELLPRLRDLILRARAKHVQVTLDAEELDQLELSLRLFEALWRDSEIDGWSGFGLAVQTYQKRVLPLLQWLAALAQERGRTIPVRLVKGAYWDAEIKLTQQQGLSDYAVFTRKTATDVSYLACAGYMLQQGDSFYPQFATHNAYSIAWILNCASHNNYEFQRLHGMGEEPYRALYEDVPDAPPCRVYAPVGQHNTLLPYLVRRLLENGANSSFVNQLADQELPPAFLVENPIERLSQPVRKPLIKPDALYAPERVNSSGLDLHSPDVAAKLEQVLAGQFQQQWSSAPLIDGQRYEVASRPLHNPADHDDEIGTLHEAEPVHVELAYKTCRQAVAGWQQLTMEQRASLLEACADLFEQQKIALMTRIIREGGRCIPDALSEVREAIDFLRYYASQAKRLQDESAELPGPTGEFNSLSLHGRGVVACISPWNFPLAIFSGQIAAALVVGNAVVAKPASATPITASLAVELMHKAGIPTGVLQLVPGDSRTIGPLLLEHPALAGVVFTGSLSGAQQINRALAQRSGPILPLIAETGGINVMIADSSALLDQLIPDVLTSAFNSAGQRCSALRVLLVQDEIADQVIQRLCECMEELAIGNPKWLATDIGPVINREAWQQLSSYCERMVKEVDLLHRLSVVRCGRGHYLPPHLFEIPSLEILKGETFGPVLHLLRYRKADLPKVIDQVNAMGYGLTLGLHSRLQSTTALVTAQARVGNIYINRNMIGAVVGSQPFGGEGLSGTGPKAGGPHYLLRFAHERTVSINTTAIGGNPELLGG